MTSSDYGTHVSISAVPECDAVAASETKDNLGVLVRLRAPTLSEDAGRAPIDLVMVLDVSGSMSGPKLDLVKRAASFVIDQLGPSDQLSVISFADCARRNLFLCRMMEQGRADAKRAVDSLFTLGGTNIVQGLTMGVQVLEERLHRNPVASILFLSDGQDIRLKTKQPSQYLPSSIARGTDGRHQTIPIHSFGFGSDHDPLVMNAIADFSGGIFSFIECYESVQQAFASCIGGLLSVVVRELCLTLRSSSEGVVIKSIPSGKHVSEISNQGSRGKVAVGDLYADEEKEFLVNISVPVYVNDGQDESNGRTTPLLDIMCSYIDELSNAKVNMEYVEIMRPDVPLLCDVKVKLEVDRQRNRLDAVEGLANAQRLAETGNLKGACDILSIKISSVQASASGQAGDGLSLQLEAEMKETKAKMGCKRSYEMAGRAYALSSISAHGNQRAMAFGSADAYVTPNMANMVNKSQQLEAKMKEIKDKIGCKRSYEKAGRAYALSSISVHDNQRITASGSADAYVTPNMANMVDKSRQLEAKMKEIKDKMGRIKDKMGRKRSYEKAGRAYALSSISEHDYQRTTASGSADAYVTPNTGNMVNKSRKVIKSENVKMEEC